MNAPAASTSCNEKKVSAVIFDLDGTLLDTGLVLDAQPPTISSRFGIHKSDLMYGFVNFTCRKWQQECHKRFSG